MSPSKALRQQRRPTLQIGPASRFPALIGLVLLALVAIGALLPLTTPDPRPVSAPADEFSASRAATALEDIASVPRPTGSAAQAEVREYLVDRLRDLGLEPDVTTEVAVRAPAGRQPVAGTVTNIYASIPGEQPTGRVLLVAHYDSVPIGPGASDNGANVAALLEIGRALQAGPRPRNDIGFLFTDGEEHGMVGAQAFADSGAAGDPDQVVVLNLEARGVSGPVVLFEMAGTGLMPAVRAGKPVTTSLADAVYQYLPNDTDFTVFDEAGMRGVNVAFINGWAHYHTAHDDIDHVDHGSVQDMGDFALAAVRWLGAADLRDRGVDSTYFSIFGAVASYPTWLVLPLAIVVVAAYLLLLRTARHRGLSLRGVSRAAGLFSLSVPAAALVGLGGWWLLASLRPDFALVAGAVYHPGRYVVGQTLLLTAFLAGWYWWTRRRASMEETTIGVLGWFSALALVCAVLLPGAAYLFTWPALIGVATTAVVLRQVPAGSPWRTLIGLGTAVAAVALLLPVAVLLVSALGLALTVAPLLLLAFLGATLLGLTEPRPRARVVTAALLAVAVAGVSTLAVSAATDGYGSHQPRPVSLGYVLEADTQTATWVSRSDTAQPVVGSLLTGGTVRLNERVPPLGGTELAHGPAPLSTATTGPSAELAGDRPSLVDPDGVRTVEMLLSVPDKAHTLDVYVDSTDHEILDGTVDGAPLPGGHTVNGAGPWSWGFYYVGPPSEGIVLQLRVRGDNPLRMRLVSHVASLPTDVNAPALPPDVSWAPWPSVAGQTFVARTLELSEDQ